MTRILRGLLLIGSILLTACSGGSSDTSSSTPVSSGPYTVAGKVRYEDLEYASSGQTGNSYYKPVRNAVIDLLSGSGAMLATTTSDEQGAFQFATVTTQPATIRVMAQTTSPSGTEIIIKGTGKGIWSTTMALTGLDLTQPVAVDIARDATAISGVFNMLDVYSSGLEYVAANYTPVAPLPPLNIYWPNLQGTYTCPFYDSSYCVAGEGIYITGAFTGSNFTAYDQDHYDDDVLWHELAHYVEYALAITESPGGSHSFYDNTLDLRLAWSEGHADYFQTAIKRWLRSYHPERLSIPQAFAVTYYVDTVLDGSLYLPSVDLANPGGAPFVYATNEVAVAKVVWDVSSLNSGGGEYSVWSAWTGSWWSPDPQYRDHSLELFWDGLVLAGGLTTGQIYPLFSERSVNYSKDSFELQNDGTLDGRAVVDCTSAGPACLDELHTHYLPNLVADVDIVPISVTAGLTYTIKTRQLTNGADSKLRLLDGNGQVLLDGSGAPLENDDIPSVDCDPGPYVVNYCNNGSNFSSQLTYVPAASGIIYVEVSNADFALHNAGAYGGYTLTIDAN